MKQLTLRLADDVHARLKAQAEREHRSMHAELLHLIDMHLRQNGPGGVTTRAERKAADTS